MLPATLLRSGLRWVSTVTLLRTRKLSGRLRSPPSAGSCGALSTEDHGTRHVGLHAARARPVLSQASFASPAAAPPPGGPGQSPHSPSPAQSRSPGSGGPAGPSCSAGRLMPRPVARRAPGRLSALAWGPGSGIFTVVVRQPECPLLLSCAGNLKGPGQVCGAGRMQSGARTVPAGANE